MSTAGSFTTSKVEVDLNTVQEATRYRVEFFIPIPLSQGCILEIQFPSEIDFDGTDLTLVQAFGLPSTQRTLSGTIDTTKNSYFVTSACPSYRDNVNTALVYFTNIENPLFQMTTGTFNIYIYDSNSQMLLSTGTTGPKLTTAAGTLTTSAITADLSEVNAQTFLTFEIQPVHEAAADSQIIIYLPVGEFTVGSTCSVTAISLLSSSAICTTSATDNSILISKALAVDYTFVASAKIKFKVGLIKLPSSIAPTSTFKFEFKTSDANGVYQLVDTLTTTNLFQAEPGELSFGSVVGQSLVANAITSYTIQFRINNPITQGAYFIITLPSQLTITSPTTAQCSNFIGFQTTPSCVIASQTIRINSGFSTSAFSDKTILLSVTVSGVQNPRSVQSTSSFIISSFSAGGFQIDQKSDLMTVQMTDTNPITSATIRVASLIVGENTTYTFNLRTSTILITGDLLFINFPPELSIPLTSTLSSCTGITQLTSSLTCSINGPYGLKVNIRTRNSNIPSNAEFSFSVRQISNPATTATSSLFQAEIQDAQEFQINKNNPALTNFKITLFSGARFRTISVTQASRKPFIETAFTFTMTLVNTFPQTGILQLVYPSQITINEDNFGVSFANFGSIPQCSQNSTNRTIICSSITSRDIVAGTSFSVRVQGLINSKFASPTDSFEVYTYTSDRNVINFQDSGLSVSSECNYPCFTCSSNPGTCRSCDLDSTFPLLFSNQCLSQCTAGFYQANFQCLTCNVSCSECSGGPDQCTKCRSGMFLEGNQCVSQCTSSLYIPDSRQNICNRCSYPCGSCSGTVNNCTSCLPDQQNRILYQSKCWAECPIGTVFDGSSCTLCNPNCKSCSLTKDTCTSCNSPLKLNKLSNNCVESCPTGQTIDTGTSCEYCDVTCRTCDLSNPKKCLSCSPGLSLYERNSTCVSQCPAGTTQQNNSLGLSTCLTCNTGCLTCQNTPSYCTKCDDNLNYLFYNFTCLKNSCPEGYTRLSKERNICVRDGERCPYGYDFNDFGVCSLVAQVCKEGYMLNHDKTKCIPIPGAYVPIIFLAFCIGWTMFICIKYKKQLAPIDMITQLLVFFTGMQTIIYMVMVCLSIALDYMMLKSIHIFSFLTLFLLNIAFTIYYDLKLRKADYTFRRWQVEHKKTYTALKIVMFLFNFKAARVFYSQLFPIRSQFNAVFDNKYMTIVRPLFIASIVNFVLQVMPIVVMDIYAFIYVPWGYQIMVMGVDNMILSLVIFILEIIEFSYYKKLAIENKEIIQDKSFSMMARNFQDHNVMSVMDDHSMMAFNKHGDFKDGKSLLSIEQELNFGQKSIKKKKVFNKEEISEKDILSKLVRKLVQEKKFNDLYDEDEIEHQRLRLTEDNPDIEKNSINKKDLTLDESTNSIKPTKFSIEDTRDRIENKLSFRSKIPGSNYSSFQSKLQHFLDRPIFGAQHDIIMENPDSARTEKFYHQTPLKKPKDIDEDLINFSRPQSADARLKIDDFDNPSKNQEDFAKFKVEIECKLARHRQNFARDPKLWHSFDENVMREWWDEVGPESDFDSDDISHESFPKVGKIMKNTDYLAQLEVFRERLKSKFQFSNCYTHTNDPSLLKQKLVSKSKNVTRRTQTYDKDIAIGYDPFAQDEALLGLDANFRGEISESYVGGLINLVLDGITDLDSFIENKKDTQENDSDSDDFNFDKMKKSKKRKRDVQFDIDDIMGMFDIDDFGNIILNTETMRDNLNRRVNKHGYLIDAKRNIINQEGLIIFEFEELDKDEEIPMPYRFEKRKKQLLKQQLTDPNAAETDRQYDLDSILNDEEAKIEEEFQKLKDVSRPSSVDSLMGELPANFRQTNEGEGELRNLEIDLSNQKGKDDGIDQKDKDLAAAYGGKPKKKKKRANKKLVKDSADRLPTDRVFSYLHQEEERVKRMAMISYQIDNGNRNIQNNLQETQADEAQSVQQLTHREPAKDFEVYFREQLQEIQHFRQAAREEVNLASMIMSGRQQQPQVHEQDLIHGETPISQQQQQLFADQISADRQRQELQRIDSAATDKMTNVQKVENAEFDDLIQQDAMRATKFFEKLQQQKQRNTMQSAMNHTDAHKQDPHFRDISPQRVVPLASQGAFSGLNFYPNQLAPQSVMSMSSIPGGGDTFTHNNNDQSRPSFFQQPQPQQPQQQQQQPNRSGFDFYLPQSQKNVKLRKNLPKDKEKKDIVFSNIGRMQLTGGQQDGGNKIKGMEKVYLQKYPSRPTNNTQSVIHELQQRAQIQTALPANKRRPGGFRSTTNALDDHQSFRPSQTAYNGGGLAPQVQNYQDSNLSGLVIITSQITGLNQDLAEEDNNLWH